jgi:TonB-linked SusC/RagA family outer membrane protein
MSIPLLKRTGIAQTVSIACMAAVFLLSSFQLRGQGITVSGTVTEKGAPLPGVSVLVKGTNIGTSSDGAGKYTLAVPGDAGTVIFSFIGYKTQEIQIGNRTELNVEMEEDIQSLSEVVVTALGVQRDAKALGYATQKLDGAAMTKAREPNVFNSMTGRVAGLQINNQTDLFTAPEVLLRGVKPLIVIDGVPSVDNDMWKVNADDIETMTVLKGATAAALYGSIGSGGAIMITTKRGSNKLKVDINSSTMFQPSFIRIPEVQHTYGNGNNGQYAYVDGSGGGLEGGGWIWGPKLDQPDPSTPSGLWETTQYDSPRDPNTGDLIPTPFISRGKDNVENFFRTGMIQTTNLAVSGGNENSNFRVSVSNVYQKGIVPNTQLNNTSFGVSGGFALSSKLKADASLTYNRQYTDNFPEVGYGPNNYLYNLVLWIGPDIDVRNLRNVWVPGQEGLQQQNYNKSWYNNPYFQATQYLRGYYRDNVFGQFKLDYNVLPGLDLTLRTGINEFTLNRTYSEPKSYVRYDYVSDGNYYLSGETGLNLNTDFIARYTKTVGENFSFNVSAGGANRWRQNRLNEQFTDGLVIPEFYNLSNSKKPLFGNNEIQEEKVNSVYGTLDLEIFRSIFVGATVRNDWVSTLQPGANSFFYPSATLAAVISDYVDLSAAKVSFLKVRGSLARVGAGKIVNLQPWDDDIYPYQHRGGYQTGPTWNNQPSLNWPGILRAPNLSPETSDTWEIGADVRFLDGRLGVDLAYYRVREFNRLISTPISVTSLYSEYVSNSGEFIRKGGEITVTGIPVKTQNFTWNVLLNLSQSHRYLNSLLGGNNINIKPGHRMDEIWSYNYARTPGGKLILRNDGFPLDDPYQRMLGHTDPDFIFGLQNSLNYKSFTLTVGLDGRVGGKMYSTTNQKMWWGGTHPETVNHFRDEANAGLATYIAPGVVVVEGSAQYDEVGNIVSDNRVYTPNTTPVNYISWNINTSNGFLNHYYNQSFMKLREITLTYRVPSRILDKTFFQQATVSFVARNIAVFTKMPNVDPDVGSDNLQTPSTRNFGFNVSFSF